MGREKKRERERITRPCLYRSSSVAGDKVWESIFRISGACVGVLGLSQGPQHHTLVIAARLTGRLFPGIFLYVYILRWCTFLLQPLLRASFFAITAVPQIAVSYLFSPGPQNQLFHLANTSSSAENSPTHENDKKKKHITVHTHTHTTQNTHRLN